MSSAVDLVRLMAMVPQSGEGCAVCAHGGDMSSRRWQQIWPRTNATAPHGDRGRPGQGRGARDELFGYAPEDAPLQSAGTVYFAMDVDDVPAALGSRPDRLSEVRPQERAQRRTVQQIVDPVPLLTLDDLAPQMVGQLLNFAHFLDIPLPDPEQVIEVPKILSDDVPMRALVRETQLVEQLVEVPTIVSYSWLQLGMEQNVDTPVRRRGERISGLQGFLPSQSSTALHGSLERTSERIVEQNVEFPVGGGLQDFSPRTELICIIFVSSWCSWFCRWAW